MTKEMITTRQGISIMILFLFGSSVVLGAGTEAKQNAWIAIIMGFLMAIPVIVMYLRLLSYFPGKDFFDVLIEVFGKRLGKLIILLYCWYFIHLGALVLRNFTEFISLVSLRSTPKLVLALFIGYLSIYMVKSGLEVIGRWSEFMIPIVILTILINIALLTRDMEFNNIKPILDEGISQLLSPAFGVFSFPFAETVIFIFVLSSLKHQTMKKKVYIVSTLITFILLVVVTMRNTLLLGGLTSFYSFPSYAAVKLVNIGHILQRIEISVAIVFILAGLVKLSICVYVGSKGIAKIFNLESYKSMIAPITLVMISFSSIIYDSFNEMVEWLTIYPYYASLFQVVIPIILLLFFEINKRIKNLGIIKTSNK